MMMPGPPIDPNSIFGSPVQPQPQQPAWNAPPAFPNQNRGGGGSANGMGMSLTPMGGSQGMGGVGQPNANGNHPGQSHIYPQIPQPAPMPQYPYGMPPPPPQFAPPQQQQPYAFGNPPPPRNNYAPYYVTTTREPSLWNQFLYNKQGGKKPSNGADAAKSSTSVGCLMAAIVAVVLRNWANGLQ